MVKDMKQELLKFYYNLKDLGKSHMNMDYDTFTKSYEVLEDELVYLFFYKNISYELKEYFRKKLWSIYNSYKYNMFYLKDYRYKKLFY